MAKAPTSLFSSLSCLPLRASATPPGQLPRLARDEKSPDRPLRILQFGTGAFLRGFVDWMVQRANEEGVFDGSIALTKLTPQGGVDEYADQDGVFSVRTSRGTDGHDVSTVTCVQQWLQPFDEWPRFLELARVESLRFTVSNSTEAGLVYQPTRRPTTECPETFPARLAAFLLARYDAFGGSPTHAMVHIPCELVEDNGDQLREFVLRHLRDWDTPEGTLTWVENHHIFVNTLVDRIVTKPSGDAFDRACAALGVADTLLTDAEPFHQWVLDAPDSVREELPFHKIGLSVLWTNDLAPYRERKVRILNGAHTAMVGVGLLAGCETVGECMRHPEVSAFIHGLVHDELVPSLDGSAEALHSYANDILERFRNPALKHRLNDIALQSLAKLETRLAPALADRVVQPRLHLAIAATIELYRPNRSPSDPAPQFTPRDDDSKLRRIADHWASSASAQDAARALLTDPTLWNTPFASPATVDGVAQDLDTIRTAGIVAAIAPKRLS